MKAKGSLRLLYDYIIENRVRKAILAILNKPKTVSEITSDVMKRLDLKKRPKIEKVLKELERQKIVQHLGPATTRNKSSKVYSLTKKGIAIGRKIYREIGEKFEYRKLNSVHWQDYGWSINGSQKRAILRVLTHEPMIQQQVRRKMAEFYRTRNYIKGKSAAILVARGNVNDILQQMVKRGIVTAVWKKENARNR